MQMKMMMRKMIVKMMNKIGKMERMAMILMKKKVKKKGRKMISRRMRKIVIRKRTRVVMKTRMA